MKKKTRVALGLSGGVDSAVSAYLLKKEWFDVHCVYLNCYDGDTPGCRGDNDRKDALTVAMHLGLPFQTLDFRKEYQEAVIDYFKSEYEVGRTPNPDVVCNREIKFGLFYDWVMKNNFDYISTGHYARILKGPTLSTQGRTLSDVEMSLCIPKDLHKDQTYFLWQVPREKFQRVLFPLGEYLKSEVRTIAKKIKLPVDEKKDSTGICFIGEVKVEDFLKRLGVKEKPGKVVMRVQEDGPPSRRTVLYKIIGSHSGVAFYTIGQRHGFEINGKIKDEKGKLINENFSTFNSQFSTFSSDRPPLYVIKKDVKHNRLIVGFGAECYKSQFEVSNVNWLASEKDGPFRTERTVLQTMDCLVRIRHGGDLIHCSLKKARPFSKRPGLKEFLIRLSSAQRGIAPGQSAVFYSEEGVVLGGGVINN